MTHAYRPWRYSMTEDSRLRLFNVSEPFEITQNEFQALWPLVTNVWTQFSYGFPEKGDEWTVYACRRLKHRKSSGRKDGVEPEKRRKTNVRDPKLCSAKIRITRIISRQTVRIEPYNAEPAIHMHPIDESDMFKKSQALHDLISAEAVKNYRPPAIAAAVRELAPSVLGEGTRAQYIRTQDVANIHHAV